MSIEIAVRSRLGRFRLDVRFEMAKSGVTALFGPSGAGKTSVVNAVAGLLKPQEGRIVLNGRVVVDTANRIHVPSRFRRVGYVFQDSRLFPHMSVRSNLLFGLRRAATPPDSRKQSEVVALLDLERLLARAPRNLSGGEKQRVALGRALLASPDLLLLDEPMASLDLARRAEVLPYLERLRDEAGLPMLYVSHMIDEVGRLANDIVVLREGRVTAQGSVFDILPEIDSMTGAIVPTEVARHRDDGLSELSFAGGNLIVERVAAPVGTALRVRIAAQDVMLAREEPRQISANNVLPAHVSEVRSVSDRLADIHLLVGKTKLHARITKASAVRLALEPGTLVYAIIKAVTVAPP